ncbi:MAG: polynucleotide adenylyltransferase PcnB, partial [Woeseiaceae bacterium]
RRLAAKIREKEDLSEAQALSLAAYDIAGLQQSRIAIPRRFTGPMREMLALQPRFDTVKGRRGLNLLEHKRFRAAYDFMMLRAEVGDFDKDLAKFWTEVQNQNAEQRIASFEISGKGKPGKTGKRRRKPRRGRGKKPDA